MAYFRTEWARRTVEEVRADSVPRSAIGLGAKRPSDALI